MSGSRSHFDNRRNTARPGPFDTEMVYVGTLYDPINMTVGMYARLYFCREIMAIIGVYCATIAFVVALTMLLAAQPNYTYLFFPFFPLLSALAGLGLTMAFCRAMIGLRPDLRAIRVNSVLVVFAGGLTVTLLAYLFLYRWQLDAPGLSDQQNRIRHVMILLAVSGVYALVAHLTEMVIYRYILVPGSARWKELRAVSASGGAADRATEPDQSASQIAIGDRFVPIDALTMMEAQGNYLLLSTSDGAFLERATFSSAMDRIPEGIGIQVHRSRWIAFAMVKSMHRDGANLVIVTHDDTPIRVTRSRSTAVENALAAQGITVKNKGETG